MMYLALVESGEDKGKFEALYWKLGDKMYRVALRLLRDEHRAQDAVQTSFVKIAKNFSKINQLSAEESDAYIVTIVENTAKDMLRQEGRLTDLPEEYDKPDPETTESQNAYRRLVALIATMPDQYRHVLMLKFVEEQNEAEIARRLGLSLSQAYNRVSRGRKLLQDKLREEGYYHE